jgi:hypothetical protein
MRRRWQLVFLCAVLGCARAEAPPAARTPAPRGATVAATVLTIRESSHPPTRAFLHRVVVAGSKVRLGDEKDQWRLFDLERRTVTWVDDVARTYREVPLDALVRSRERQLREAIPSSGLRAVSVRDTGETRVVAGITARRLTMELGGYRREVWLSTEPLAGKVFLRMLTASEPISEPWAGVIREVQRTLMRSEGFPVIDVSHLTWDGGELLFQRRLVKVEKLQVPLQWVTIPAGYTDANAPATPAAGSR